MKKILLSFWIVSAFVLLPLASLSADIIVGTDFEDTTENGLTLEDVAYMTNGVTVPSSFADLTVDS